jgi:UDP-N-acetylmuramoyl-L-alanyl-D-glutamate--2,6-diaminopimelate ligase
MKLLSDILYKAGLVDVVGTTHLAVTSICFDSRAVEKFSLFIAVKGSSSDGHQFISGAVEKGAIAIVCEELPTEFKEGVTYVKVKNSAQALGIIASNFYDCPSAKLKLVGVTGTNGKTTTVTVLYNLFTQLGFKCGLISTVKHMVGKTELHSTHTTPDALKLNELMQLMVDEGCQFCFMEVSSHAVVQFRIAGLEFTGGIFSNLTHDHLDYHGTFENYRNAKQEFFNGLGENAFALVNKDDKNGLFMMQNTRATRKTYALQSMADYRCKVIENHISGLVLNMDNTEIHTRLVGGFNAYNLTAAYATAMLLGIEKLHALTALSLVEPPPGRFQTIKSTTGITAIVDYAHTPDALENVLSTINELRQGGETLITVVGCGGNRDAAKRPIMAKIAANHSDKVILTSDNPRNEDPEEILNQMKKGLEGENVRKALSITNRHEAIRTAVMMAQPKDIILVAGKGHENYQEIKGVKHPFDDWIELQNEFKNLK